MGYSLEIIVPGLPMGPNLLMHKGWRAQAGHTKKWREAVWLRCFGHLPKAPLKRARVTMIRFSSGKEMDEDNLKMSFKPVLDALKFQPKRFPGFAGVIEDDGPQYVELNYLPGYAPPKKGYIKITVEEIA